MPNLLTTFTLFFGCYAIYSAVLGIFPSAAIAILLAMVSDFLDGWVARLTHTQTPFGQEYDSLADMVAFGVGPAALLHQWSLYWFGTLGSIVAFLYVAATALRLARFNSQITQVDKHYFKGIPCTIAAGCLASMVWLETLYGRPLTGMGVFHLVIMLLLSALEVSNVSYISSKILTFNRKVSFLVAAGVIMLLALISLYPPLMFVLILFLYALSGPCLWLYKWFGGSLRKFPLTFFSRK